MKDYGRSYKKPDPYSLIKAWLVFVFFLFLILGIFYAVSTYPERSKQVNHNICSVTYGLNDSCK